MSNPIGSGSVTASVSDRGSFMPPAFHSETWYQHECGPSTQYSPVDRDVYCKFLIVGAGLAGLSTAVSLVERGNTDIVILEQGQPGEGASGRNGGFVFGGYSRDPEALARQIGVEQALLLQDMTHAAVERIRRRCQALGVSIHEHGVLLVDWFKQPDRLQALAKMLNETTGLDLDYLSPDELQRHIRSERYGSALMELDAFHFNPLHYVNALAEWLVDQGVRIYGNSRAHSLAGGLQTPGGRTRWSIKANQIVVQAEQLVIASGGYSQGAIPWVQRSIQPIATYIAVTEPIGPALGQLLPTAAAVYDNRFAFDYYRRVADHRLLWGGRISILDRSPKQIEQMMRRDIRRVFPDLAEAPFEFCWGGWMSYARHQMPVLGMPEPGLWLAIAFGGHGMAPTNVAGEVLADAISGRSGPIRLFRRWGPVWAGGTAGRLYAQSSYMFKQTRDWIRAFRAG